MLDELNGGIDMESFMDGFHKGSLLLNTVDYLEKYPGLNDNSTAECGGILRNV